MFMFMHNYSGVWINVQSPRIKPYAHLIYAFCRLDDADPLRQVLAPLSHKCTTRMAWFESVANESLYEAVDTLCRHFLGDDDLLFCLFKPKAFAFAGISSFYNKSPSDVAAWLFWEDDAECSICFEPNNGDMSNEMFKCMHSFCSECRDTMTMQQINVCPLCRVEKDHSNKITTGKVCTCDSCKECSEMDKTTKLVKQFHKIYSAFDLTEIETKLAESALQCGMRVLGPAQVKNAMNGLFSQILTLTGDIDRSMRI